MKAPDPKAHLIASLVKSSFRLVGSAYAIWTGDVVIMAFTFLLAEVIGVVEELF